MWCKITQFPDNKKGMPFRTRPFVAVKLCTPSRDKYGHYLECADGREVLVLGDGELCLAADIL